MSRFSFETFVEISPIIGVIIKHNHCNNYSVLSLESKLRILGKEHLSMYLSICMGIRDESIGIKFSLYLFSIYFSLCMRYFFFAPKNQKITISMALNKFDDCYTGISFSSQRKPKEFGDSYRIGKAMANMIIGFVLF